MPEWWQEHVDPWIDRIAPDREIYGNDVERWLVALALLFGLWIVFRIVKSIVRSRAESLKDRLKSPWAGAVADLAPGYDGVLRIGEVEIPADQLELDQGLNKLIFRPGEGKVLTRFEPGPVHVSVTYWPLEGGRLQSRIYQWTFKVV